MYSLMRTGGVNDATTPAIWRLKIPTKVKVFLWLVLKKRLLTIDNLLRRRWSGYIVCVMCGVDLETVDHLLVGCVASKFLFISLLDELRPRLSL